jgi:hypothetical protein
MVHVTEFLVFSLVAIRAISAKAAFNTRLLAPVDIAEVRIARPRASPLGGTKKNAEIGSPSVEKQHNVISALTTDERLAAGLPPESV